MPKYIDADDLIAKLEKEYRSEHYSDYIDGKNDMIDVLKILIDEMSPADVVEVIRCKDCKYSLPNTACGLLCGLTFPTPNSYCSYAERKDDG